ncbi:MAG: DNA lyase [Actinobacteria bacterium]|nr:MAG: DNA lyase [Actinomycetota bacterium]
MRLWSLDPSYLDAPGLVACWRESLLAQKVLRGKTRGYRHHPQLARFRACSDPLGAMGSYLKGLEREAKRREYRFNADLIVCPETDITLNVTSGQVDYEMAHLRAKISQRSPALLDTLPESSLRTHPLFTVVDGPIEPWEIVSPT